MLGLGSSAATAPTLAVAALALAAVALAVAARSTSRLRRLHRDLVRVQGAGLPGEAAEPLVASLARCLAGVERVRGEVADLRDDIADARADGCGALRHVAVVRYDAFGDQTGQVSFSLAAVDDHGNGLVLSGINGRRESRVYAKGVQNGSGGSHGGQQLSPEEERAVGLALGSDHPVAA